MNDIRKMLDDYLTWVKDKTTLREIDDSWVEITTPHLDRHNDAIQIYVRRENGGFLLTDGGYIIQDLKMSGCGTNSGKRKELLTITLNGFGVSRNEDALEVHATLENFPIRKHNLIQAMLGVNDLFYTSEPRVASLFHEDVTGWLDDNDVRYVANVKFTGTSGFDHSFNFVIPKSRKQPERILEAINKPARNTAENLLIKWTDTRDVRSPESKAFAVLNDGDQAVSPDVMEALRAYEINPILWSRRHEVVEELAA